MNRDNEDVVTIRLGDLSHTVEQICKRRNISRSDFVKEALSVATKTDPAEAADLFLAFIIFSERMLDCAKSRRLIDHQEWAQFVNPFGKLETKIRAEIRTIFAKKHPSKVKHPQSSPFPSLDSSHSEDRISVRAWFKMMEVFGDFLDIPMERREKVEVTE